MLAMAQGLHPVFGLGGKGRRGLVVEMRYMRGVYTLRAAATCRAWVCHVCEEVLNIAAIAASYTMFWGSCCSKATFKVCLQL